ncbi:hypothetical protein WKV44_06205 [Spirochaetia bacterium 38H-sp]|uniref:HD domain-containing protein n=1 Tax=Rarispira pelagica TaxID=3141764 RepID=A0ABU9UBT9_9SPIR
MHELESLAFYFMLYSFLGWIIESAYRSITTKTLINSGSLYGPFIPIYGFGAVFILLVNDSLLFLPFGIRIFIFTLIATSLEYFTSYIIEKTFGLKFWDYSNFPLNINGRVCLLFSSFWAILSFAEIEIIQPFFTELLRSVQQDTALIILVLFYVYIAVDTVYSFKLYKRFASLIIELRKAVSVEKTTQVIKSILSNLSDMELARMLRPARAFGFLRKNLAELLKPARIDKNIIFAIRDSVNKKVFKTMDRQSRYGLYKEFRKLASEITETEKYRRIKSINHHGKSIYQHNLKVAWVSYLFARRMNLRLKETVQGALLHDYFFYDWKKWGAKQSSLPHGFSHPTISYKNAKKDFPYIGKIERDIIIRHMWPLTVIPPITREGYLVSFVDKYVAASEFVRSMR